MITKVFEQRRVVRGQRRGGDVPGEDKEES